MAGRIRDADIAEVRDRNRIDEVVGDYVALRPAGPGSLKGLCPFHDEKSPSFNVRTSHNTYHCFGCGEGGSVIDFIMKMEQLGFVASIHPGPAAVSVALSVAFTMLSAQSFDPRLIWRGLPLRRRKE